ALSDGAMTLLGCEPDLANQEDWYFGFLQSAPTIELDGDVLVLEGGDTRIEYLDPEIATPDLPLVGPPRTVDTAIQGEGAGAPPWPDPAALVFTAEGTVEVLTGCNQGTASYQVSGTSITFADLVLDEMECTEQTIVILDDTVQGVLG